MDYHSLPRKQLQALCKKHDIPANQTNVQMADALTTLLQAEGKPKSDANAGRMQNVRVASGKENSNVPKVSTRSNKEPVKSTEGGVCEENVASVEDAESNEGVKVGKTRGRGLSKLVPESKESKDEIDGNTRKHCRDSQREKAYKNSVSDFSTVDVTSKKMDKKKTIASEDEAVGEKAIENIEGQQSLRVEEASNDQENHGKHLRHPRKKTMPEEQTKPKVVDVGTKRSRAGKATYDPDVATELSVKDVDVEQKNVTNKAPVIIDIVDSDDEEAVKGAKDKADMVDVSVEPTVNLSEPLKPVVNVNASLSPKPLVTRKGHKGGHKKEEVLKTSSEEVRVNAVCNSVEPASNSSMCLKKAVTLKGEKEEKEVTASFEESKIDTVHVSDEPAVKQRGQKGGRKEKSIVTNSLEEAKNIVTGVPVEAIMNDSESPKRVITRKGCKPEHKKEMLKTSSEEDKVDAAFVSAEPTTSSLKFLRQIVTRRAQKSSQKEEMQSNASSEEDKIDVVSVSDGPALNQRGRKGGRKGELVVANSVVEAKNIVTDVPVEATVHASEFPKGVVTRKGSKGEQKEVLKTGSDEEKFNVVCVSVGPTSTSLECLKQVVSRRGQKCSLKEEKLMNVSSEENKIAVINAPDEPTVNQRGRKGRKKGELFVTNSIEEAKNTIIDVPVEATVNVSESPKGVVTRKARKGEHKAGLKTGCEEDKFNAVCVSNECMSTSLQCLKQVVTRRGHKSSHNEKAVDASSEDVFDVPAVNRRGRRVGQKKESVVPKSSQEVENIGTDVPVEVTLNVSKSTKQVVTRKGCKGEHKKGELLKANAELTMNCSESPKQAVTQRDVKCGELLVNDTIKESKNLNDTTDSSIEDNASASESPERLVHEKVLDAKEGKTNTVSIPVKPTVKCSENLKHVVTRRGGINKQEGSKVVTVISCECQTPAVVTDSIEEVKNNATDISVEDNVNASQSSRRVVTQQESKVGSEEVVNASAKDSNVFTRRGRINRQEEVLETDRVEEAKKIPVETSLNFEDDASIEVTGNTSFEHVNASPQEIKVDASGMSDESIQGQGESSSEGNEAKAGEIISEFVDSNKQSSSTCEVDIDSVVNEETAHELRDSSSCEEEDLNDVKEREPCLDQDVEISEERTSHGDSASDQEGGDFDVDNLNGSLGSIEEETSQPHGDSAHEQEDGEIEKKPDKIDASLDLAAKDEALEEQTMAGSTVFTDNFLDQSLESLEKDSNLLCEAGLEFSVDEEDPRELRDFSSCEEDNFYDVKEKEIGLIQDLEISQERAAYGDSFNDQEDGDFEKCPENVYCCLDSAAKGDDALEEQIEAGDGMIAASTVFVDNILGSVDSLKKATNLPCEVDIDSAVDDEGAHELKDSSSCEDEDLNDAKEKELCLIQDVEISQQKASHVDSTSDQEDGDLNVYTLESIEEKTNLPHGDYANDQEGANFEKEPDNVYTCSDLATEDDKDSWYDSRVSAEKDSKLPCEACLESAVNEEDAHKSRDSSSSEEGNFNAKEDGASEEKSERVYTSLGLAEKHDDALEEQTTAGDGMIAGSTVYVDNILDKPVESQEKDSNFPCELDIDSAVYEDDAHGFRDSCIYEENGLNDVIEKELVEMSEQKVSHGDSASNKEDGDFEKKSEDAANSSSLTARDDDTTEEQTLVGDAMIAGSTVFADNILDNSVELLEIHSNLPCEVGVVSAANEESAHELRDFSSCEEGNFNYVQGKELHLIQDLERSQQKISYDDSASVQENGDFEMKSEKFYTSSELAAKDDEASKEKTMASKGMIAKSIVFVNHMLGESVESQDKIFNLQCKAGMDVAVNEEDLHESNNSSSTEEDNINDVNEIELNMIGGVDLTYDEDEDSGECQSGEITVGKDGPQNILSYVIEEVSLSTTPLKKFEYAGSSNISYFSGISGLNKLLFVEGFGFNLACNSGINGSAVEEKRDTLPTDCQSDASIKISEIIERQKELWTPIKKIEFTNSTTVSPSLGTGPSIINKPGVFPNYSDVDNRVTEESVELPELDNPEEMPEITKGQVSPNLNILFEEDSQSKKSKLPGSTNITPPSSVMDNSATEWSQEDCLEEDCNLGVPEIDSPSKTLVIEKSHKESLFLDKLLGEGSPKKCKLIHSNVVPHSGMDDSVTKQSEVRPLAEAGKIELFEFDCAEDSEFSFSPCLNIFDTPLKNPMLRSITVMPISSGMNDFSVELNQGSHSTEACMEEDCELGVPEIDSPSKMLVLEKGHDECLFLGTLFGEGTPAKKCELINANTVPHSTMDDSAIEQSEANPRTGACTMELYELNAPSKISNGTKDDDFSFSPCLNIFDTPLKDPVLQCSTDMSIYSEGDSDIEKGSKILTRSITVMPISSGMEEDCWLGVPEIDSPSKMLVLEKGHDECLFLGTPAKKCELINANTVPHSTMDDSAIEQSEVNPRTGACRMELYESNAPSKISNGTKVDDFSFSPCLNIFDTPLKDPVLQCSTDMSIYSGGDSDIEKGSKILTKKVSKLNNHDLQASPDVPTCVNDQDISPWVNILSVKDFGRSLKNSEAERIRDISACSGVVQSATHRVQEVLPTEASKNELSQIDDSYVEKCGDRSPFLNTLFVDKIVSTLKNSKVEHTHSAGISPCGKLHTHSAGVSPCGIDDSDALPEEACKLGMSELSTDDDTFPCLKALSVEITDISLKTIMFMRGIDDSARDESGDVPLKMAENTEYHDRSPCLETLFVDDNPLSSGMDNSTADQTVHGHSTEDYRQELAQLDASSKMSEVTKDQDRSPGSNTEYHDRSPCLETLFVDDNPLSSGMDNSTADQTVDGHSTEDCRQELAQLDASSKMSEVTMDQDRSPGSNIVFREGIGNGVASSTHVKCSSAMKNSILEENQVVLPLEACKIECNKFDTLKLSELTKDGLPTEDCRHGLAQLDASSKMSEVTKDQDRSPGSNIVFLEGIGNCVASSTHVKCSSAMKDSILEENQVVLPLETCKIECTKFDTTLRLSELTKDDSLSPCLNMDSITVLEMSKATNGTDISICSGGTDSGLHKMLEIHRTEDSKLQMALVRQGSSTSSEMPKLSDIDGLLQCADIDIYAPEHGSEILPIDSHLKMGHDNPGFQSRQAVGSDLTKLSLRHLRRLYKEKQMKRKKSGKVIRKHPAFGEESQQDCKTQLQCNVVTEVNETLNKPEVEASEKLDKPEEFHQKSPAENDHDSLHRSPVAGTIISENMFGESPQDCKTDICCNNDVTEVNIASAEEDPLHVSSAVETIISEDGIVESQEDCKTELHCSNNVSQVNIALAECEIAEGSEKFNKPEEFSTGSNYVLPQTAPVEIGLPEVTSSYRASPAFNSQPSEVYSPMSKPELAEACDKPDKLDEDGTSLKKSKDTGDHDLLCESTGSRIVPSETVHADERNGLALDEKPSVPNNSVESGLFVEEHTVCKEESRIPKLVDRLKILNDRLQSLQSNLQGLAPESTYATPLRKAMNCKSIGSAKKNRIPMSVGRFSMTSTKENPTDRKTPLSLKKDQRSYNENQIKSKDSEKVVGKRPALRNLSLNVLEERDQTALHIHEEN